MFCHIVLQATTTENFSYMICQSYWKMYQWLSERARMWCMNNGAPTIFSRDVGDDLNNSYHDQWIGRGGPTAWPSRSSDFNPLDIYLWGHWNPLVYASAFDDEEALYHRIVDACQTIPQLPRDVRTDAAVYDETWWGVNWNSGRQFWILIMNVLFQLEFTNSVISRTCWCEHFFFILVCGTRAQNLSVRFSYTT
jgi:hypothetical protein